MTLESTPAEDLRMDPGALMVALWARALRIVLVSLFLVALAYGVLLFVPKLYESSSSLLVEDRPNATTETLGAQPVASGGGIAIDALMSSQIELIKSRDTLLAVIGTLNLDTVPEFNGTAANPLAAVFALIGKKPEPKSLDETVLQNLNDRLTVIRERDSAVISIFVRSADPDLAAKIANAIAAEHVKRRAGQSLSDTAEGAAWLQQQIDGLRVKVKDADTKVADYKSKNGIFAGSNGTTLPDQQISDIGKQITDAQGALNTAQQHSDLIRSLLKSGQPLDGVDDVRNSPTVQALMQNRATLQSTLAEKLATLLPAHPTIIALNAQIAQINKQIQGEARHIADGLDAQVRIQTGLIKSLNDDLQRAQLAASTQTKDSVTLDSLTREAKVQHDLLDSYMLKQRDASGRTDAGSVLPDVRIITQAAPSVVPASPKTALILGAVGFVALALQIGMVLFGELTSGRALYDRNTGRAVVADEAELEQDSEGHFDPKMEPEESAAVEPDGEMEPDLADMPEPVIADAPEPPAPARPSPAQPSRYRAIAADELEFSNLSADVALGRARLLLVAAIDQARDAAVVADNLVADALAKGLSVCRVDAGSGRVSSGPGLTDLCAEQATYGDIVHKVRDGLAEVPWGQLTMLDRRSMRPLTLVEALTDIYEVVIVTTGRIGLNSSLPLFTGTGGWLVIARRSSTPIAVVEAASADAAGLRFDSIRSVAVPERETAVA